MSTTPTTTSTITPYICVSPATEALAWYRDALGAVETIRYTGDDGRVGHAEMLIAGAHVMLSDEYPELEVVSPTTLGGTPTTLHVAVPDVDAVYERVVAAGARVAGTAQGRGLRRPVVHDDRPVRPPLDDPDPDRRDAGPESRATRSPEPSSGVEGGRGQLIGAVLDERQLGGADALVAHRSVQVAGVHALADHGQTPRGEGDVEVDRRDVAPGPGGVALEQLGVGREPGRTARIVVAAPGAPGSVQYTAR